MVVTYTVDEGKNIDSIDMYMPNPYSERFELVEELSAYIDRINEEYKLTEEEARIISSEPEIMDPNYFDVVAASAEVQKSAN